MLFEDIIYKNIFCMANFKVFAFHLNRAVELLEIPIYFVTFPFQCGVAYYYY